MTADRPPSHDHRFRLPGVDVTVRDPSLETGADAPEAASDPAARDHRRDRASGSSDRRGLDRFQAGDRIGHFEIKEEVGRGGMGVVYRAWDERLQREVAVKFLPAHLVANPESKERFLREARAASALDHPHVATVHEIGETARGEPFLVMSYYAGHSLEDQLRRGPLPVETALAYAEQIADALEAAHGRGLVHRDIKPSNILIPEAGPIKLLDFGLARWMSDSGITQPGRILGTVSYMSPEQLKGEKLDGRSDLWALGVVLYEMLSGSRPFAGRYEHALMYAITHEDPPSIERLRPGIAPQITAILERCLAKDPHDRFESAGALNRAIQSARLQLRSSGSVERAQASGPVSHRYTATRTLGRLGDVLYGHTTYVGGALALTVLVVWFVLLGELGAPASRSAVPDIVGSRIAVLPLAPATASGTGTARTDPLLSELAVALTHVLGRIDPEMGLDLQIIPFSEMGGVATVREVRQTFEANYVLTLDLNRNRASPRLTLTLVDAGSLDQIRTVSIDFRPEARGPESTALTASLAGLLDLSLTPSARRALELTPDVDPAARRYYELARRTLEQAGDTEDLRAAVRLFEWAIEVEGDFPEAHAGLAQTYGQLYQRTGDAQTHERALSYAERARASDATRPSMHVSRGLLNLSRGEFHEALLDFKIAATLDSTQADAYRGMGNALARVGRSEEAEQAYRDAIRHAPEDWRNHRDLGQFLFRRGRFEEAADRFRTITEIGPHTGVGHLNLGGMFFYLGKLEAARDAFETLLDFPTLSPRFRYAALSNLGTIYYYQGRFAEASAAFENALEVDSTSHLVWGNLGSAYNLLEDRDEEADRAYARATTLALRTLELNPRNPEVLLSLGSYRLHQGDPQRARELMNRALREAADDVDVLFQAGHLCELLGDRDRAVELISEALKKGYSRWIVEADPELADLRASSALSL